MENLSRKEKLLKLVTKINCFNGEPTEKCMEYVFLDAALTDDEMIEAVMALELRVPIYLDDLAERIGKSRENTAELVYRMAKAGIIEYMADEQGVDRVYLPVFVPGAMELACMRPGDTETDPRLAYTFDKYIDDTVDAVSPYIRMGEGLCRAMAVEKAIKNDSKRVHLEEASHWVEKNYPSIGVAQCECRHTRRQNGEMGHDLEGEWCIVLGTFAESCIRTGKARRITREEAYEILQKAEDHGYVHELTNIYGKEESTFICNCQWTTCGALRTAWYCNSPNNMSTNYRATVQNDSCVACGECVKVCPINAVKLGKRLCDKEKIDIAPALIPGVPGYKESERRYNHHLLTEWEDVVPETGTAPCKTACPAHIAIQGYIKLAGEGRYREALELIKKENPLPAVCGSICNKRCEETCTRRFVDEAVSIDEIKKFIAEQEINGEDRFIPKKEFDEGKKIAVIGSGPAGLACAYYLAVYGHQVTVFEKEKQLGGMLTLGIPSFRLDKDVVEAEIDVLRQLGVKFVTGAEIGKLYTIQDLRLQGFAGFYIAIGAQGGRLLHVEGEDAEGVSSGIDFLKKVNTGEGFDLSGKTVVIGGGNVAVDVARSAVRLNTDSVAMFCLESREEMPASAEELEDTEKEGIAVHNGWGPKRIWVQDGKVTGVEFKRCTAVKDSEGRFAPQYDENDTMTVACDHVLTAIGQSIQWGNLLKGTKVGVNPNGTAQTVPVTDVATYLTASSCGNEPGNYHLPTPFEVYQTAEPDIFVGGDVYSGPKFAIDAIAAGKEAAESLHRYVWPGHNQVFGRDRRLFKEFDKGNLLLNGYDQVPRERPVINASKVRTFQDPRRTLSAEQIQKETSRCLGCGAAHVDETLCIGCGLCTTRCKFDAIHLSKKYDAWGTTYEELVGHIVEDMAKDEI